MRIGVTECIAALAESIFALSQDYARRLSWDPFLRKAELLGGAVCAGVGIRSWCVSWFGLGMESEYVSFRPPRMVAVKMTRGPWLLRLFASSWSFRAAGPDHTEVGFVYSFRVRSALRFLTPLVGLFFRYEMRRRLHALKKACESDAA